MDDMELLHEYAGGGNEQAFTTLVARHINMVHSVALRHVRDPQQAEEIAQAVFVILARKAAALPGRTILSAWLFHTARLTAANFLRTEIRRARREQEAYMQSGMRENQTNDPWGQMAPLLDEAIASLNETDRDAIVLRFVEGRDFKEVGAALGATEDSGRMRVNRALEKLRVFLARRGVALSAAVIAGALSANAVQAAPPALLGAVAVAVSQGASTTATTATLIKGTLKLMAWTKLKITAGAVVGVLLAAGTTTVIVKYAYPSEPEYQGKTLSYWLASLGQNQLQFSNLRPQPNQPAAEAFQSMGAKAVPFLHPELRSMELARRKHAAAAAHAIGPSAKKLTPDLLESAMTTAGSGHDPYDEIFALAAMGPQNIASLTNMFTNPNKWARQRTAEAFFMADYDTEPAVPALLQAVDDADPGVRGAAAQALGQVHKQLDVILPALLKNLRDPEASVRWSTADAMGRLGPDAKTAFPALLELWRNDPDRNVGPFAANALKRVDPEAAAQAGVK